jgi:hypothetical protein
MNSRLTLNPGVKKFNQQKTELKNNASSLVACFIVMSVRRLKKTFDQNIYKVKN